MFVKPAGRSAATAPILMAFSTDHGVHGNTFAVRTEILVRGYEHSYQLQKFVAVNPPVSPRIQDRISQGNTQTRRGSLQEHTEMHRKGLIRQAPHSVRAQEHRLRAQRLARITRAREDVLMPDRGTIRQNVRLTPSVSEQSDHELHRQRVPRMTGLPASTFGSNVIEACSAIMLCRSRARSRYSRKHRPMPCPRTGNNRHPATGSGRPCEFRRIRRIIARI